MGGARMINDSSTFLVCACVRMCVWEHVLLMLWGLAFLLETG